ncbi:branched-chain amino acid transporter [uncultured Roseobacter sp.]|uniref:branched-chain amino acid transporter n=1 Tax=uncultured Roseobacter sp. TaxID=114847 RepID=UPI00262DDD62|nr:branched-chain amino acid transporter [uncultured Roseobacter sp.]
MTGAQWALLGILAIAAFGIRVLGLVAGRRIRSSPHAWVLAELPGLIVVSLVAASLAGQPVGTWVAAGAALGAAVLTNHVIATMIVGVLAFAVIGP